MGRRAVSFNTSKGLHDALGQHVRTWSFQVTQHFGGTLASGIRDIREIHSVWKTGAAGEVGAEGPPQTHCEPFVSLTPSSLLSKSTLGCQGRKIKLHRLLQRVWKSILSPTYFSRLSEWSLMLSLPMNPMRPSLRNRLSNLLSLGKPSFRQR